MEQRDWDIYVKETLEKLMAPGLAVTILRDNNSLTPPHNVKESLSLDIANMDPLVYFIRRMISENCGDS